MVIPSWKSKNSCIYYPFRGGYNYVTNLSSVADEYDDFSDEEQGMQHINDDEIGYGGCYGYSGSGVSKFTTVLIDNIFPTAKTSIIGKEVGEFELLTSSSVWNKKVIHSDIERILILSRCQKAQSY